jgi:hypothetical protein
VKLKNKTVITVIEIRETPKTSINNFLFMFRETEYGNVAKEI